MLLVTAVNKGYPSIHPSWKMPGIISDMKLTEYLASEQDLSKNPWEYLLSSHM